MIILTGYLVKALYCLRGSCQRHNDASCCSISCWYCTFGAILLRSNHNTILFPCFRFYLSYNLGKSSNRSPENFSISAKLSNIQKMLLFQRKVLYTRSKFSNDHCDPSIYPDSTAKERCVPLFCNVTPNHTIQMT